MIEWTIEAARAATSISEVIISSNDTAILKRYNGTPRHPTLCGPDISSFAVVKDALKRCRGFDAVCLLQPTSPLRTAADIDNAVGLLYMNIWADSVVSYTPAGSQYTLVTNGAIYLARRETIEAGSLIGDNWLPYVMPASRSVDVDTAADLALADMLLQQDAVCA